ncbi:hypothetical protein L7F22_007798 [Adiantum nelumboides]|nr:hypothetical protein [Adiantum nelumboides]
MAAFGMLGSSTSSSPGARIQSSPPRSPIQPHHYQQQQQQQQPHQQPRSAPLRFPNLASEAFQHRNRRWVIRAAAATESRRLNSDQMLVYVPPHPLIKHWISVLRNELSPPPIFKSALAELGRYLIYEASRDWLTTVTGEVQTPCGVANVEFIDPRDPVRVIPILRAGLVLVEHISSVLPATQTYHVGFQRDETTLRPRLYLNKLPERFPDNARVIVADPMLATGGTMVATIDLLKERNVDHKLIRVVSAVAAPPALKLLGERFPGLRVYTGVIDPSLNEKGYIVPGLGDAGDRSFGT